MTLGLQHRLAALKRHRAARRQPSTLGGGHNAITMVGTGASAGCSTPNYSRFPQQRQECQHLQDGHQAEPPHPQQHHQQQQWQESQPAQQQPLYHPQTPPQQQQPGDHWQGSGMQRQREAATQQQQLHQQMPSQPQPLSQPQSFPKVQFQQRQQPWCNGAAALGASPQPGANTAGLETLRRQTAELLRVCSLRVTWNAARLRSQ